MRLEMREVARTTARAMAWLFAGLVALGLAYLVAGQIGGAIPGHGDRDQPGASVTIYVESNGIHTGIVMPLAAEGVDWSDLVRPEHLPPEGIAGSWLSFGWGERDFYLNTPTWADLQPLMVLRAAIGSDATLMHVDHLGPPRPHPSRRPVTLSIAQYQRLAARIRAGFRLDAAGQSQPLPGYGAQDVFYEGTGRYTALVTCNTWVGDALRDAGVRMGLWTPFPWTVMWWFDVVE